MACRGLIRKRLLWRVSFTWQRNSLWDKERASCPSRGEGEWEEGRNKLNSGVKEQVRRDNREMAGRGKCEWRLMEKQGRNKKGKNGQHRRLWVLVINLAQSIVSSLPHDTLSCEKLCFTMWTLVEMYHLYRSQDHWTYEVISAVNELTDPTSPCPALYTELHMLHESLAPPPPVNIESEQGVVTDRY